jgi:hypothetical protein
MESLNRTLTKHKRRFQNQMKQIQLMILLQERPKKVLIFLILSSDGDRSYKTP